MIQAMENKYLVPDVVDLYRQTRACDPESFDVLFATLKEGHYRLSVVRSELQLLMPGYEKSAWRPGDRRMHGRRFRGSIKIPSGGVVHEGFHALITRTYGAEIRRRPYYVLLAEALATSVNVYFDIQFLATHGYTKRSIGIVDLYTEFGRPAKLPVIKHLNRALRDPFAVFRGMVLELNDVYRFLFEQHRRQDIGERAVYEFLRTKENLVFMLPFDISNNVLFAKANCGMASSVRDGKICSQILRDLNASGSMAEFLRKFRNPPRGRAS